MRAEGRTRSRAERVRKDVDVDAPPSSCRTSCSAATDIAETHEAMTFTTDAPGMDLSDIDVFVDVPRHALTIQGERNEEITDEPCTNANVVSESLARLRASSRRRRRYHSILRQRRPQSDRPQRKNRERAAKSETNSRRVGDVK